MVCCPWPLIRPHLAVDVLYNPAETINLLPNFYWSYNECCVNTEMFAAVCFVNQIAGIGALDNTVFVNIYFSRKYIENCNLFRSSIGLLSSDQLVHKG